MVQTEFDSLVVGPNDLILITGAAGFIGLRLVESLLERGFRNLRCFARPSNKLAKLKALCDRGVNDGVCAEVFQGNLLSREDCATAVNAAAVIFHLAATRGEKSIPGAFLNTVVTTRNLLEASRGQKCLRRFLSVSSFAVYSNLDKTHLRLLDESSPIESHPEFRGDAYCFAKVRQDEIVSEYGKKFGIPYVIVRPGYVYGPGNLAISGRVGIDTFGLFLHLGGSNTIPLTYIDNCVEAIALAGLKNGVDGNVVNVVDDDLPSSRQFLRMYKRNVKRFRSLYIPHSISYALCYLWERYSIWSEGQLAPAFNRREWHAYWKKTRYSNHKLKTCVGWTQKVSTAEGLRRYFEACRTGGKHA
jgi:nucleoside-diphosphate-sugar epimerase